MSQGYVDDNSGFRNLTPTKMHVVFGMSAAATLRDALTQSGRVESVICTIENFSFGPIASPDHEARLRWLERELRCAEPNQQIEQNTKFVTTSRAFDGKLIAWVSFKNTCSYANFLWWLSHIGDAPFALQSCPELNIMNAEQMIACFDQEAQFSSVERTQHISQWQRLTSEGAPLRIIDGGVLVSAPIDYFDPLLLSFIHQNWQKMALIVAKTLSKFMDDGEMQTDDLILSARLRHMAETGVLEWQGDLTHMRGCELRRPPTH